jgi:NADH-quinone oxidoreductase subunit I
MSPWPPSADELHVVESPDRLGGPGSFYRAFGETLRGLKTTLRQSVAPVSVI